MPTHAPDRSADPAALPAEQRQRQARAEKRRREAVALERVQRRVGASVFLSVAVHAIVALPVVAKIMLDNGEDGNALGMMIMCGVVSVLTVVGARLILAHHPLKPAWLALSIIPLIVGIWYVWYAPLSIH